MKALILSDLHISAEYYFSGFKNTKYKRILNDFIKDDYDIVIISGDVFECSIMRVNENPFDLLNFLFNGKPVVFCLGNHEFAYQDYNKVIDYWNKMQNESKNKDIHCLDVENGVEIGDWKFVGNVFWYDWSLNQNQMLMKGEILDSWLDTTIKNFNAEKEHEKCKEQILKNVSKNKNNILVTHCVPHWSLNTFSIEEPYSAYNSYSGCKDFLNELKDLNFKYSFCGHTHRREIKEIYGIKCYNIGNDYLFKTNKIVNEIVEL